MAEAPATNAPKFMSHPLGNTHSPLGSTSAIGNAQSPLGTTMQHMPQQRQSPIRLYVQQHAAKTQERGGQERSQERSNERGGR